MTAIIPLNDDYQIELNRYDWAVARYTPRKDKSQKQWEQISWHRTLSQAGESLGERLVAEDDLEGVNEVINAIRASAVLIATAIKECPYPDSWLEAGRRFEITGGSET